MAGLDALHEVFAHEKAMLYWSHTAHEHRDVTRKTPENLIRSYAQTGAEYVIEFEGRLSEKLEAG